MFHYENIIDTSKASRYVQNAKQFDKKLNVQNSHTDIYCCRDFITIQRLLGIQYKWDYNSFHESNSSKTMGNRQVVFSGVNSASFTNYDLHDLWHDRLELVISRNTVHKAVDEGCAYLYGGSWGIPWTTVLHEFKAYAAAHKDMNWLKAKSTQVDFGQRLGKRLLVDYTVNALLVQEIEKKKGFPAVWQLLNCGVAQESNEKYFAVLNKLTGINKSNYNKRLWKLINESR